MGQNQNKQDLHYGNSRKRRDKDAVRIFKEVIVENCSSLINT